MKLKRMSVQWNLFLYFTLFVASMLVLLWLFQTVFLDSFYKSIKIHRIKSSAESIAKNIDNPDLQDLVARISEQNDLNIKVTDEAGRALYSADNLPESILRRMPPIEFMRLRKLAEEKGGTVLERFRLDKPGNRDQGSNFIGRVPPPDRKISEIVIHVRLLSAKNGSQRVILLNSMISPVNATVDTLRVQLICITIIMLVLAFFIALLLSRKIAGPIVRINRSARNLANGNPDIVFDGDGYREISELNDTLTYAAKELSKTEKLRRELIANVSHDLRTPLTMITGYAEAMCDLPGENTVENVQIIIEEAKHLTELVNDMLDYSKLQSGTQELNITEFNLTDSIRSILDRYSAMIRPEGYHITFRPDRDVSVRADEMRISQVIYNLMNNAVVYTGPDRKVSVVQTEYRGFVRIEVRDTGDGIPEDQLKNIWDRYYKLDKMHSRVQGTGLGLSIVKSILTLHGARFGVQSRVGEGSTFWFELNTCGIR